MCFIIVQNVYSYLYYGPGTAGASIASPGPLAAAVVLLAVLPGTAGTVGTLLPGPDCTEEDAADEEELAP